MMNGSGEDRLRGIYERRLADLYEDFEAAVAQQGQVLDAVSVKRLQRQAESILADIEEVEAKLAGGSSSAAGEESLIPSLVPDLIQLLNQRFSEDDLKGLALALGVEYEVLPAVDKESKARELVMYAYRRERLDVLVEKGWERRPDIDWSGYAAGG